MSERMRDAKGRFISSNPTAIPKTMVAFKTVVSPDPNPPVATTLTVSERKEDVLAKLRTGVYSVKYDKFGKILNDNFTLHPSVLGSYVGKGTSKKVSSDILFAYDVVDKRFKSVKVSKILSIEKLTDF